MRETTRCLSGGGRIGPWIAGWRSNKSAASGINIMKPRPKKKTIAKKGPGRVEAIRLAEEA
jgi:hypothetical protein